MFAALNFFFTRKNAGSVPVFTPGQLWSWGGNTQGELGLGNRTAYSSPKQVGSLTTWAVISAAGNSINNIAVKSNNTLWSWGGNASGQLGLGNVTSYSSPVQVGSLTNWSSNQQSIVSLNSACLAVKTDGTLWAWGFNFYGQLGLGTSGSSAYKSSPNQVGSLTNWNVVSNGSISSGAVKTDGTLWTWGGSNFYQLGLNNQTSYSSPVQVGSLTNWSSLNIQYTGTLALKTDGTIWSWGSNSAGQLGLGNITNYSSPKQVGSLTTWLNIGTGTYTGFAVSTSNALWAWGRNDYGQSGLGNTTNYSSPKQVGLLTTWLKPGNVSGGGFTTIVIKTNGELWSWGINNQGQLGLGTSGAAAYKSSPNQVGLLTTWQSNRVGQDWNIAIKTP